MKLYNFLEHPMVYNYVTKIFSLNNKVILIYFDRLIDAQDCDKILDVGCGTGKYAIFNKGYYLGIDPSEEYIDYARKSHSGDFLVMDGKNMTLKDESFNKIFCMSVFHHLPDNDTIKIIQEMKRVLSPGGEAFIIDAVYPKNPLGWILFKLDRGKYTRKFQEAKLVFEKLGFQIIDPQIKRTFPYHWCVYKFRK